MEGNLHIGLLDDDLIREAEEYKSLRKRPNYRRWGRHRSRDRFRVSLPKKADRIPGRWGGMAFQARSQDR